MESFAQPNRDSRSRSQRIAEEASERLQRDPHVRHKSVSCECEKCVLWLHGELPTFYGKQAAQEAVKRIDGIAGIINNIKVTG